MSFREENIPVKSCKFRIAFAFLQKYFLVDAYFFGETENIRRKIIFSSYNAFKTLSFLKSDCKFAV